MGSLGEVGGRRLGERGWARRVGRGGVGGGGGWEGVSSLGQVGGAGGPAKAKNEGELSAHISLIITPHRSPQRKMVQTRPTSSL